ncbi:MAG TPA: M20 family metallopeptidase [Sedimentisphaerales bacterium]|nr:M20 family metallopeptidase [Sedimentisphaerales bacterium]
MKSLLQKLVRAESTAKTGELAAANVVREELARLGIRAQVDTWDRNRANLVCRIGSKGDKKAVLFACHLDVVPPGDAGWSNSPFEAVESNGRIYGRGAADMKGGIAAVVTAIRQIIESKVELHGDLILFAAAGEETDSCGATRFVGGAGQELPELAGIILPEPTDFEVVTAHRGMLWLEVTTTGKTAHGSSPQLGINAIASMKAFLDDLEHYRIPHEPHELLAGCSMSVNTITGGEAINVVPDRCSIGVDIRTLPGQNSTDIIEDFQRMFANQKAGNPDFLAEVSVIRQVGAMETDPDCAFVKDFCSAVGASETTAVGFTTDGPHFAALGAPVLIFGPGKPEVCHKPDEYIDVVDLERAVEHCKNVILKFLV